MARVQDYYQNRRDLGKSSMVAYLDAWLTERSGMNKALMAPGKQADPGRLAEQEAKIRKAIADLMRAKVSGSVEEVRIASELAETLLRGAAQVTSANAAASARVTSAKIGAKTSLTAEELRLRKRVASDLTLRNPDALKVVAHAYKDSKADGRPIGPLLVGKIEDITAEFEGGNPAKRDAIAAQVLAQAEEAGDDEAARAIKKAYFEAEDADVDGYFARKYPTFTPEEHKKVWDEVKKMGGGASTKGLVDLYEKLVKDGAGGGGTKTSASSGGSGAGAAPDSDAVLAGLEAAADDLAAARHAASAGPARKFPRPNYMIANPNTYTDPRQIQDLERWGVLDSKYVEEVAASRQAEGSWGGAVKAIGDRGGLSQRVEHVAPLLLTNNDGVAFETPSEAERRMVAAWTRREVVGKEGYRYTLNTDGTLTSQKPGGRPVKVEKGSVPFKAIVDEIFAPGLLPGEVADLYAPARALAEEGLWEKAAERARDVDPDDVRSAYAKAIRDVASGRPAFEGVPAERQMEALAASIGDGGGKWGEHFRALLDQPVRDEYGRRRVMGAVESLADAMDAAPAIEDRLRAEASWEDKYGLDEVTAGREVNPEAYGRGKALGETAAKGLDGSSDKRVREAERALALLDDWERKNPIDLDQPVRHDPLAKEREGVAQTRLRLEREIAQIKSKAQDALPENVDVTLTELKAGRLGLRGDEALGARRAFEAKQDAMKAPKWRVSEVLGETRPPPEPGLSEQERSYAYREKGTAEPVYQDVLRASDYLDGLSSLEQSLPDLASGVQASRKVAEDHLARAQDQARARLADGLTPDERTPEARGAALLRDRLRAERGAEAAAVLPPSRIPPRAAPPKRAPPRTAPPAPPQVMLEDADLDALLSSDTSGHFEDADLDALLSQKATK